MSTTVPASMIGTGEPTTSARLASIDIFRGLTMVVMIFVNDLASVHGLPWWNYHMAANINAMTYVDMVFPFFLFIVGLSIPLAVRQRLSKNPSVAALLLHVLVRAGSLVVLGLILANADRGDATRMGIDPYAWAILALGGASLYLSSYKGSDRGMTIHRWLRVFGLVLTIAMFAIFRRTGDNGQVGWIDGSYAEILGIIGYTYLVVAVLYISTRRWLWAPLVWFAALLAFNIVCVARWNTQINHVPLYLWPFNNGGFACMTMAGIVVSTIFSGAHRWQSLRQKTVMSVVFGGLSLVAGWLLTPLGISKIRATPTWCLYCIGAAALLFTLLYWVCDVNKKTAWASFVRPAGTNTLLTYLIPDFYYFLIPLLGITYFETHFNFGWMGAVRSVLFTAIVLVISGVLTRLRVRLQL